MDTAITTFLGGLGFDLEVFEKYFPAVTAYYDILQGFAVGLLLIMLVFQLFRNFGVILDIEAEDPLKLIGKTALFYGMIISSRSVVNIVLKLLTDPYSIFLNAYSAEVTFSLLDLLDSIIGGILTPGFMSIVYIIMLLVLGWQFLKFIVEVVERYIVFFFVLQCAPVVFATGAFKSTSQIFKSWCRMLGSQSLLLLLNVWSIKLFASFMTIFNFKSGDMVLCFLMGYAFLKFSQKADTLLRILGLNTASTGDVVHALGSTIGGIAQTIRTAGAIAGRTMGGRGGAYSRGSSGSTHDSGGGGRQNGGIGMAGMNGGTDPGGNTGGSYPETGGIGQNVSGAAQAYSNDVLAGAKMQMAGGANNAANPTGESTGKNQGGINGDNKAFKDNQTDGNGGENGIHMGQNPSLNQIDAETREGLANLAHGLPHNQYNNRKFSGGGFQEFTGENANIIGASQLTPADGYSQSAVKMADGSHGTLYKDGDTGKSHIVQFGSVDNGVIQGAISEIDGDTGKMGDRMAFKAVHESVPGAESFSANSVPVSDSEGGTYHVATGADTSFLSASHSSVMHQPTFKVTDDRDYIKAIELFYNTRLYFGEIDDLPMGGVAGGHGEHSPGSGASATYPGGGTHNTIRNALAALETQQPFFGGVNMALVYAPADDTKTD